MLDDKDSRDDWVNAIRSAIKSKFLSKNGTFQKTEYSEKWNIPNTVDR